MILPPSPAKQGAVWQFMMVKKKATDMTELMTVLLFMMELITEEHRQYLTHQIMLGTVYQHAASVGHRDLKASFRDFWTLSTSSRLPSPGHRTCPPFPCKTG